MTPLEKIYAHLQEHTFVMGETCAEDIGEKVVAAMNSGYDNFLPKYVPLDPRLSDHDKKLYENLSALTRTFYFLVKLDHNVDFDIYILESILNDEHGDKSMMSDMWTNAMRSLGEEAKLDIGQWAVREATYCFETKGQPLCLFKVTRT